MKLIAACVALTWTCGVFAGDAGQSCSFVKCGPGTTVKTAWEKSDRFFKCPTAELADYVDTVAAQAGSYGHTYTITFKAASAGQTLTVSWIKADVGGGGNVGLSGVALS